MDKEKIVKLLTEIKDNNYKEVIVYSLEGCPACDELKKKFDNIGITYEQVVMNGNDDMWEKISEMGGSDCAPQVKIQDYLIKEEEYESINELISRVVSKMIGKNIILK